MQFHQSKHKKQPNLLSTLKIKLWKLKFTKEKQWFLKLLSQQTIKTIQLLEQ